MSTLPQSNAKVFGLFLITYVSLSALSDRDDRKRTKSVTEFVKLSDSRYSVIADAESMYGVSLMWFEDGSRYDAEYLIEEEKKKKINDYQAHLPTYR